MTSNYKRIGNYIQLVNNRNIDLETSNLLGINIDKFFMPSVANIVGTDLRNYKLVKKGQFACNRMHVGRDLRIPIALAREEMSFIVSPAYDVFEIIDSNVLNEEYLMMWFSRREFDRNAWFYTDADVRGGLPWKSFCNIKLPVPTLEKQQAIVNEYNIVLNRIKINATLIQKLEETAQALYKQWFVDFEFPNENGKPYKSSGGEMVWNEELEKEIPGGWEAKSFTDVVNFSGGGTPSTQVLEYWNGEIPFYTPADLDGNYFCNKTVKSITVLGLEKCSSKLYPKNTIFLTARGATVGGVTMASIPMAMNQTCYAIWGNENSKYFAHQITLRTIQKLKKEAIGATFEALVTKNFNEFYVAEPQEELVTIFDSKVCSIYTMILNKISENENLLELNSHLLSKIASIEN
jgi:type I restriction enzyme, S subunit